MPWTDRKPPHFLLVPQPLHRMPHQTTYLPPSLRINVHYRLRSRAFRRRQPKSCSWFLWPPWKSHPKWWHPRQRKCERRQRSHRGGRLWQPTWHPRSDNTRPSRGNPRNDNNIIGRIKYRYVNTRRARWEQVNYRSVSKHRRSRSEHKQRHAWESLRAYLHKLQQYA